MLTCSGCTAGSAVNLFPTVPICTGSLSEPTRLILLFARLGLESNLLFHNDYNGSVECYNVLALEVIRYYVLGIVLCSRLFGGCMACLVICVFWCLGSIKEFGTLDHTRFSTWLFCWRVLCKQYHNNWITGLIDVRQLVALFGSCMFASTRNH